MTSLALTDDELTAMALMTEVPWPSPLPTIDAVDSEILVGAASRGRRSLVARELLSADGPTAGAVDGALTALLEPALSGRILVSAFVADRTLAFVPEGLTTVVYAKSLESALMEAVSAGGIHYFSEVDRPHAIEAIGGFMVDVLDGGISVVSDNGVAEKDGLVLCVASAPGASTLIGIVAKDSLSLVSVSSEDGSVVAVETPDTVGEALELIIGRANETTLREDGGA
jgi:hypothetical protein